MDTGTRTLENISSMHRFNAWMAQNIRPFVGSRVLEVGAGIGNITRFFVDREFFLATDVDPYYLSVLQQKFGRHANFQTARLDLMEDVDTIASGHRINTIICLNVLEHIRDDEKALKGMFRILTPGGNLVLLVPAFRWLFGTLDVELGHYRRYTRKEVFEKLSRAGFSVIDARWMNMFGMPGWFLNARIRKVASLPERQLRLYDRFVPIFRFVERLIGPPIGQSIIAIGKKPQ